jgi:hypothetical protein
MNSQQLFDTIINIYSRSRKTVSRYFSQPDIFPLTLINLYSSKYKNLQTPSLLFAVNTSALY